MIRFKEKTLGIYQESAIYVIPYVNIQSVSCISYDTQDEVKVKLRLTDGSSLILAVFPKYEIGIKNTLLDILVNYMNNATEGNTSFDEQTGQILKK